jgi:hypothetical protein
MTRARVAVAAAVLVLPLLAGCSDGQSYCDAVKAHQSELGTIVSEGGRAALISALPAFEDLAAKAPSDVTADWKLLVARVTALKTALDRAGVDPASYDPQHPPPGLSAEDRGVIRRAAARLAASDTQQALTNVQQEVLDVCHTPVEM